jgi:tetratricopeptide (TPR) repeat protein
MLILTLLALGFVAQNPAAPADWHAALDQARQAFKAQKYQDAFAAARAAEQGARGDKNSAAVVECLRLEASAARELGNLPDAAAAMQSAAEETAKSAGADSIASAAILEDTLPFYRAQRRDDLVATGLEQAIAIREVHPEAPQAPFAHDLTAAATLEEAAGQVDKATARLTRAIRVWDAENPADPQCLPALEALAAIWRNTAHYDEAEPLLLRSLRLREDLFGPDHAELLATLDSLAYVEFGLKKMPEAETLYKRMLDLWQKSAGPDHPMVALTLDKMAEFYAFQQRYADAERCASAALELRMKMHMASLNQTGRILIMRSKVAEAEDLYHRTMQIGDLARAPDEVMDPPLRVYATILRAENRPREAAAVEKRVKDALLRKADREGRREPPK